MSLTAMTQSPPPVTTCSTISFWQPIASIVMSVPARSICSRSCGMAVISLDLASVATWPSAIPSSLAQALTMCRAPRPFARVVRPATGLAVDGDETCGIVGVGRDRVADPGLEAALEGLGLQRHEQATDAVARGDAVGQGEVLGQPGRPMLGPAMDGGGAVAAAEDAADGDDDDIDQEVLAIARVPGVGERFEVGADGADVDELGHGSHPGFGRCGPWRPNGGTSATRARGPEPRYRAEARRARLPRPHSYTRGP